MHSLFGTYKDAVLPVFQQLLPHFVKLLVCLLLTWHLILIQNYYGFTECCGAVFCIIFEFVMWPLRFCLFISVQIAVSVMDRATSINADSTSYNLITFAVIYFVIYYVNEW